MFLILRAVVWLIRSLRSRLFIAMSSRLRTTSSASDVNKKTKLSFLIVFFFACIFFDFKIFTILRTHDNIFDQFKAKYYSNDSYRALQNNNPILF